MFTVLTWFWRQPGARNQYEPHHILIWADMVRRHLSMPHRIACVTSEALDLPSHMDIIVPPRDFEDVRIPTWGEDKPQCLRRLSMFAPHAGAVFGDRFVCMDLDVVIADSLDPLFETEADFKICAGTAPSRPYNGSMMLLRAGARAKAYSEFTPERAAAAGRRFLGSDQAWIGETLPGEATWGEQDGVCFHTVPRSGHIRRRLMFFAGQSKPWMMRTDPWIADHYRRDPQGRCLLLGYSPSLWTDVEQAIEGLPFQGVIASPEAASHWPGRIIAVAQDDDHAENLAEMHGFGEVVWCGRTREAA